MITIREREDADLDRLVEIAARVHERDRYPIYLPDGDFERFITHPRSTKAWVAVDIEGVVVGHAALNEENSEQVMQLVDGGERTAIYVSRLFVDPDRRTSGVGRALLDVARRAASELGRLPALDVVDIPTAAAAIALYERAGWTEIGRVSFDLAGSDITERVFIADEKSS